MFIKPLSYYSTSRGFLNKAWGHGKFMASKIDGIMRQSMDIYGAVKPIAQEAAQMYGGGAHLAKVDQAVSQAANRYKGVRAQATQGAQIVDRLAGAIGGY